MLALITAILHFLLSVGGPTVDSGNLVRPDAVRIVRPPAPGFGGGDVGPAP